MAVTLRKRGKSYSAYWREDGKVVEKSLGTDHQMAKIKSGEIEKQVLDKRKGINKEIKGARNQRGQVRFIW